MLQALKFTQSLAILGQYDIWVRSGAISILGAVIHASSRIHRVYAPSTHSIPPIRPLPNPFGTGNAPVELTIISCRSRMRMLRQIAPKFGRIWNGRQQPQPPFDFAKRSFMNVSNTWVYDQVFSRLLGETYLEFPQLLSATPSLLLTAISNPNGDTMTDSINGR